jgi:hypothetical protein
MDQGLVAPRGPIAIICLTTFGHLTVCSALGLDAREGPECPQQNAEQGEEDPHHQCHPVFVREREKSLLLFWMWMVDNDKVFVPRVRVVPHHRCGSSLEIHLVKQHGDGELTTCGSGGWLFAGGVRETGGAGCNGCTETGSVMHEDPPENASTLCTQDKAHARDNNSPISIRLLPMSAPSRLSMEGGLPTSGKVITELPIPKALPFSIALVAPNHPMLRAHLVRQLVHLNCPVDAPVVGDRRDGSPTTTRVAPTSRPWTHAHYEMTELEEVMFTSPRPLWDAVSTPCLVSIEIPDPNVTPMSSMLTTLLLKQLRQMHIASWLSFVFIVDRMSHLPWVLLDGINFMNITGPALQDPLPVTGILVSDFLAMRVGLPRMATLPRLDPVRDQSLFLTFFKAGATRVNVGGTAVVFDPSPSGQHLNFRGDDGVGDKVVVSSSVGDTISQCCIM